ncbi:MAG: signal peptidase II [Treponema sp.]|jgi:signal peptidase II|nr:signal peptidase II [Treponema sp.]
MSIESAPLTLEQNSQLWKKIAPFSLALLVLVFDQFTKFLIIRYVPPYPFTGFSLGNDFLRIIHVRNSGIAFSVGGGLPSSIRSVLFVLAPLTVVTLVVITYFRNNDFTFLQRWAITGVIGGGLGNLIDRLFRPEGVVDFIDVKFYGLFGLDRWPTFNIADAAVLICAFIFMFSILFPPAQTKTETK